MALDAGHDRWSELGPLTPFQIAESPLLNAREKLSLLSELKAQVAGALEDTDNVGFAPSEIDEALDMVHAEIASGQTPDSAFTGEVQ